MKICFVIGVIFTLLFPGCGGKQTRIPVLGDDFECQVRSGGSDSSSAPCGEFSLTPDEARQYLEKATPVTWAELEKDENWSPCYILGVAGQEGKWIEWEIRPNGAGRLVLGNGESLWLKCADCEKLLLKQEE
jgi:hypothetical protein